MKKGLFIGRFQPAHRGHLQAMLDAYKAGVEHFVIGIGSAQKEWTEENPFTFSERKKLLEFLLVDIPFTYEIHPIPDVGDNQAWYEYVICNLPACDIVISGNPWLEGIFSATHTMYTPEITVPIKGTNTRKAIALDDAGYLGKAMTSGMCEYLKEIDARKRLLELMSGLFQYKIGYECILDNGDIISISSTVPYKSAHAQIYDYIKNTHNIEVNISSDQPIWKEVFDEAVGIYRILLSFKGIIAAS